MTAMTIVSNYTKKTAKPVGVVAAGEVVHVTISDVAADVTDWTASTLRLRVMSCAGTLAMYPQPDASGAIPAAQWDVDGDTIACDLNLNSVQMVAALRHLALREFCLVLDDTAAHVKYFSAPVKIEGWRQEVAGDPYDLSTVQTQIAAWEAQLDNMSVSAERFTDPVTGKSGVEITAWDGKGEEPAPVRVFDAELDRTAVEAERDRAVTAEQNLADAITGIDAKIPAQASAQNQLADKAYVNSSIATNTATFRGTYNLITDLGLTLAATEVQVAAAIAQTLHTAGVTPDNNDYVFVQVPAKASDPTVISRIDRYKCTKTGDVTVWGYEWSLNNSSFTQAQWDAINSGITSGAVAKLAALPTAAELANMLAAKLGNTRRCTINEGFLIINDFRYPDCTPLTLQFEEQEGVVRYFGVAYHAGEVWRIETNHGSFVLPRASGTLALTAPNPTAGRLAALDANGNLVDSGKVPADFAPATNIQKSALASDVQTSLDKADGAATKADATLTPVYGEWVCNPAKVQYGDPSAPTEVAVAVYKPDGQDVWAVSDLDSAASHSTTYMASQPYDPAATSLTFTLYGEFVTRTVTATRAIIGYTLGSQTDKPLQPAGDYASATKTVTVVATETMLPPDCFPIRYTDGGTTVELSADDVEFSPQFVLRVKGATPVVALATFALPSGGQTIADYSQHPDITFGGRAPTAGVWPAYLREGETYSATYPAVYGNDIPTPNLDYVMRVDPETGGIYYTTPDNA